MLPDDFYTWMPTAHHNNPKIMEYINEFLNLDLSPDVYYGRRMSHLFYIWGHSYEFDNNNNWEYMEEICEKLANNPEIWYATNIEICDYVEAYKRLKYSADGHRIYNPTVVPVYIEVDGVEYCIKPDETITV